MTASVDSATPSAAGLNVSRTAHKASTFGRKAAGSRASVRPNTSRIWLAMMMTAMPAVKATSTLCGMYLISEPSRR